VVDSPPGMMRPSRPSRCVRQPYLYRLNAQAGQDMFVLNESTLQSQDTNFHHSSLRPRNPGQTEQVDH
jgi:hypothetical protein